MQYNPRGARACDPLACPPAPPPDPPRTMTKTAAKPRRRRSTQRNAIREIKKFQNGKFATVHLVPKSCFNRVAREIARDVADPVRFREDAMSSLQTASEAYITSLLMNANKIAAAQKRMTLQPMDVRLAHSIVNNAQIDLSADMHPADDAESESDMDYVVSEDGEEDTEEGAEEEGAEEGAEDAEVVAV